MFLILRFTTILISILKILCQEELLIEFPKLLASLLLKKQSSYNFILDYSTNNNYTTENSSGMDLISEFYSTNTDNSRYSTLLISNICKNNTNSVQILETNWRAMKRLFTSTIIISSENFNFIRNQLYLYGPNVTERHTNIFIIISQSLFDQQRGSRLFRRDYLFGKMYADLTIILRHEAYTHEIQPVCVLCKNALEPPKFHLSWNTSIASIFDSLMTFHKIFNRKNAHASTAWLCRIGFRWDIFSAEYHSTLENTARKRHDGGADKNGIMLGILMRLHNFTFIREPILDSENYVEEGNYSGLYLSPGGDMPTYHIQGRKITLSYIIHEVFLYCRKTPIIPATSWDFLWSPFEFEIWTGITITVFLYILLHKGEISYGLDIFWAVLGLPGQSDWSRSKFLNFSFLTLITLNVSYLSVITSKVIIPNRELDIESTTELFAQGYRFIDSNVSLNGRFVSQFFGPALKEFKVNNSIVSNVVVEVPECDQTHNPKCISKWAGFATGLVYEYNIKERFFDIVPEKRELCHRVKEPFRKYWVGFYIQGPLSRNIYKTHQTLIANGIERFWENLQFVGSYYWKFRNSNHTIVDEDNNNEPKKLNFETPILVVFKTYGVLIGICALGFIMEGFFYRIKVNCCKWNRFKINVNVSV